MRNKISLIFLIISTSAATQNIATNPGFETYSCIPSGATQWNCATGWSNCSGGGSPDYAHMLGTGLAVLPNNYFATVSPHSGDAIMGFILWHYSGNFREYISTSLSPAMVPGQLYDVSFFITNGVFNGNYGGFACDQVSVAFSTTPLAQTGSGVISVIPDYTYPGILQDSAWHLVSFQFTPTQAFTHITIGNFVDDASTQLLQYATSGFDAAYYFADDLEVKLSNVMPAAAFLAATDICPGTCTDFTNLSTNATTYQWFFPGGNPASSTDINPVGICYNTPGNYDVTLIASNTVGSDTTTLPNFINVFPYSPPQSILQYGDTLVSNTGFVSYQWFFQGDTIAGATDHFYVALQSGNYSVICLDANGCSVEAVVLNVVAGLNYSIDNQQTIIVYPNPADQFVVFSSLFGVNPQEIFIYNSIGETQQVVMLPPDSYRDPNTRLLTISHLPKGLYYIELRNSNKVLRCKFVKD